MTRPRTLPENNSELENLLRKHTQQEVADMYGVSNQAVSKAIRERNLSTPQRVSYKQWIPWRIAVKDSEHYFARTLRYYAMEQIGKELPKSKAQQLAKFKLNMDAEDLVVQYDPHHPKGPWLTVPRRHGIDTGYVRNPEVP